ncbi:Uncharacterized protein BP5553_05079 [Venustampulla echinocandica]|uniref:Uncharacterized protein n=1 Tax=Venustampulla echinocandica TaxID=2656787 RepID=A0A370TQ51_9HELO|nr:Uncharacterized protein BP5553_05079 [Venustampulla echinocandica]RDL37646.1 Uncharacterized protein BP5553_05079 [Venustampulla echinocandica]
MAAISTLQARDAMHQLVKRKNWAAQEAGVVLVFCIVFIVAVGLIGLFVSRWFSRRKAARRRSIVEAISKKVVEVSEWKRDVPRQSLFI